ncbi:ferredoxin--nitrite reductase [Synechococcus sp. A10-1-5-1]|uniref:ferredoxin--nitrite reductase n=1 Tax=Synechococcus sp. A10-1-5-1 TaxID=2936507 RepID=UPI0020009D83|nr:ferredoxin--nitrite reductase [Synechococcus sp. A10-1-5-1]UPM49456.1 ferredoxin--nitrite reductase [Synechococcus sp. A10-1-5-1]
MDDTWILNMTSQTNPNKRDLFSRFVNWISSSGDDKAPVNRPNGSQDIVSRLMNRISG